MGKIIRDLWILIQNGMVIYNHSYNTSLDPQLFGGFMSAIQTVAAQFGGDGLSNLELGTMTFYFSKVGPLLFITTVDRSVKPKKAQEELQNIVEKFVDLYPLESVTKWKGNLAAFDTFKGQMEESFETPLEKMKASLW